jgi:hypothetical protein
VAPKGSSRSGRRSVTFGHARSSAALTQPWKYVVLATAAGTLQGLRPGVVPTLIGAGAAGALAVRAGALLPH